MKNFYPLAVALLLSTLSFSQNGNGPKAVTDTVVKWTFPTAPGDSIADGGITANLDKLILREPSFTGRFAWPYPAGVTTKSISSTKWNSGNGTKYWYITFATNLYDSINISSAQRSSPTGPRNFRVDYSLNGTNWTPVTGANIVVRDNFTSGKLTNVQLTSDTWNQTLVYLRWIVSGDTSSNNADTIKSAGTSRIDNIYILGKYNPFIGIENNSDVGNNIFLYPNPSTGIFNINTTFPDSYVAEIYNSLGQKVYLGRILENNHSIDIREKGKGIFLLVLTCEKSNSRLTKKIIVK